MIPEEVRWSKGPQADVIADILTPIKQDPSVIRATLISGSEEIDITNWCAAISPAFLTVSVKSYDWLYDLTKGDFVSVKVAGEIKERMYESQWEDMSFGGRCMNVDLARLTPG